MIPRSHREMKSRTHRAYDLKDQRPIVLQRPDSSVCCLTDLRQCRLSLNHLDLHGMSETHVVLCVLCSACQDERRRWDICYTSGIGTPARLSGRAPTDVIISPTSQETGTFNVRGFLEGCTMASHLGRHYCAEHGCMHASGHVILEGDTKYSVLQVCHTALEYSNIHIKRIRRSCAAHLRSDSSSV